MFQGVKRVTEDLDGAMVRWFSWAQAAIGWNEESRISERWSAFKVLSGWESAMVTSSA